MHKDATFWIALAVAFVLGLLPGLGVLAYQRQAADRSTSRHAEELRARQAAWETDRRQFEARLASADATVSRLEAQVTSLSAGLARAGSQATSATPASSGSAPVIVERSVDGETAPGQRITLVVKVKGDADKVTMRLAKIRPDSGWAKTYDLEDTGVSGGARVWRAKVACPEDRGDYRFYADAYRGDTHVEMPGVSLYEFTVE